MIDYDLIFNKLTTRKKKTARTSQAFQSQAQDEDGEYGYFDKLEILEV